MDIEVDRRRNLLGIRAYRINKLQYENSPSFSLGDEKLWEFIDGNSNAQLNEDGCGVIDVEVECLEKALLELSLWDNQDWERESIAKDIIWAKKLGKEWVQYYIL